ncbi:nucleoside phosphorylase domain-containing protein [Aspergillus fruticulosus]
MARSTKCKGYAKCGARLPLPILDGSQQYTIGRRAGHNVVVACLPSGVYRTTSATTVLSQMLPTFARLRFGLMVGIGGGMPREDTDIRLGDVVGSLPGEISGGVNQYNFGKTLHNERFQRIGSSLNNPPQFLLMAISQMCSDHTIGKRDPYPHHSWIVSGNQVIKEAAKRDALAQEMDILCFEAEAAGLMDQFPCLVFRGICDYCDSHKNKECQGYAALAAAAARTPLDGSLSQKPVLVGREAEIAMIGELMNPPLSIAICGLGESERRR